LSSDDWDTQMLFFLSKGYRVIAHDRRGHGRSSQSSTGHEMNTYAADVAELAAKLDLRNAIHIGHSTGGGEATRYVARHGAGRVAKAVLIGAVPPLMLQTDTNPGGLPIEVFDQFRQGTDFTDDLRAIDVPTLVMHGDDDQVVPIADSAQLSIKLLRHGTLKVYPGFPHGAFTIHNEEINGNILDFLKS